MVNVLGFVLGVPIIYVGWLFFSDPQAGFRIHNWPFAAGADGLTEEGKPAYRVRGVFIMAMGVLIVLLGLFE